MSELGLAEFVAGLISETFEAVSASMEDQLVRQADLLNAAGMDVDAYAQLHVSSEAVNQACVALFGDDQGRNPIIAGGSYLPGPLEAERPAIKKTLGLELQEKIDYSTDGDKSVFTPAGAENVRQDIRRKAALRHQEALRLVLNKGLPRILIDSGRILSKVTFNVVASEAQPPASAEVQPAAAPNILKAVNSLNGAAFRSSLLNRLSTTRTNLLLPNTQLKVKPVADDTAQSSTTSVYGEVEITFKTVN